MKIALRIVLALFGLLVVGVLGLYLYLFQAGGLEAQVNAQIARLLGEETPYRVTIGRMSGTLFGTVRIDQIAVDFNEDTGLVRLASISSVTASYNLVDLLAARFQLQTLRIDSLVAVISLDASGELKGFPRHAAADANANANRENSSVHIAQISISNTSLTIARPLDTFVVSNFSCDGSVGLENETASLSCKQLSFASTIPGLDSLMLAGRITVSPTALAAEHLLVSSVLVRGEISLVCDLPVSRLTATVDLPVVNVEQIAQLGGEELGGTTSLRGTINWQDSTLYGTIACAGSLGPIVMRQTDATLRFRDRRLHIDTIAAELFDSTRIEGVGEINLSRPLVQYQFVGSLDRLSLDNLADVPFPSSLSGIVDLSGTSFSGPTFQLSVDAALDTSRIDRVILQQFIGSIALTESRLVIADSSSYRIAASSLTGGGIVEFAGSLDVDFTAEIPDLQTWSSLLENDFASGRADINGSFRGPLDDPTLRATVQSDSVWFGELFSAKATIDGVLERVFTRRAGSLSVILQDGFAGSQQYDSLVSLVRVDSMIVLVDSLRLRTAYGIARTVGLLNLGDDPIAITLDSLELLVDDYRFTNRIPVALEVDSQQVAIQQFMIGDRTASLSLRGTIGYDESILGSLSLDNLPVGSWLALVSTDWPVTGDLFASGQLAGTIDDPIWSMTAEIDSLVYDSIFLGQAALSASYSDSVVTLDSLVINSFPGELRASGTLSADLSFRRARFDALPSAPFDLRLTAQENRFDLVTLILPPIEEIQGNVKADVRLFGTPDNPRLSGTAYVTNGSVKYLDLADTLRVDSGGVTMIDNRILIDTVVAHVFNTRKQRRSEAIITGEVVVLSLDSLFYNIDVHLPRNFPFKYDLDDIEGVTEGDLHIEGYNTPTVTGDLAIVSMAYRANFAGADEGSPFMSALSGEKTWDLNLNFDVLSNYWIKNDDIDAEFSGDLNVIRRNGSYRFIGNLDILRGKAYLFDKTFRIEPGSSVSFNNNDSLNPSLDIYATTSVPGERADTTGSRELIEVCLHITGTLSLPEINPCDDSPLSREEIFPLLVANYYVSDSTRAANNIEQRVLGYVSNQVTQLGSRRIGRLIGVETFEIDPTVGGDLNLRTAAVTVGDYVVTNLYAYGKSSTSGFEVGAEYRLRRGLTLEGRRDQENLYHLGLKWRWEF